MKVRMVQADVTDVEADALVVNLFAGVTQPEGATGAVDAALGGAIRAAIAAGELSGALGEVLVMHTVGRLPARRVVVTGLGPAAGFGLLRARKAAAISGCKLAELKVGTISTIAHGAGVGGLPAAEAARHTLEGLLFGLYRYPGFKSTSSPDHHETEVVLVERDAARAAQMRAGLEMAAVVAEARNWARDLGNLPGNMLGPQELADVAQMMAAAHNLECTVLDAEAIRQQGMALLSAVGQASRRPPRLITLRYQGGEPGGAWLGLVGKGVTFDTGGISIKEWEHMWEMKYDMCGAAAVLGALRAIVGLALPVNVLVVVPAVENMPGGNAYRPGDVIRGLSGKTVEIQSTDAEGRVILADALAYAIRQGADRIITASTLTGGVKVALGSERFGVMSNNDPWCEHVVRAADRAGEKAWRLPADPEYRELLKSHVADMANSGQRSATAIQGGMFLLEHVGGTPTVHLDIYGTAFRRECGPDAAHGATGTGVGTMVWAALAAEVGA